jgi:hypothetical protein
VEPGYRSPNLGGVCRVRRRRRRSAGTAACGHGGRRADRPPIDRATRSDDDRLGRMHVPCLSRSRAVPGANPALPRADDVDRGVRTAEARAIPLPWPSSLHRSGALRRRFSRRRLVVMEWLRALPSPLAAARPLSTGRLLRSLPTRARRDARRQELPLARVHACWSDSAHCPGRSRRPGDRKVIRAPVTRNAARAGAVAAGRADRARAGTPARRVDGRRPWDAGDPSETRRARQPVVSGRSRRFSFTSSKRLGPSGGYGRGPEALLEQRPVGEHGTGGEQ